MSENKVNTGIPVYGSSKDLVFLLGRAEALDKPVLTVDINEDMGLIESELKNLREVRNLMREMGGSIIKHYADELKTIDNFITMLNCIVSQTAMESDLQAHRQHYGKV